MKIYKLIKLAGLNSIPAPLKLLGLWSLLVGKRRLIGVFLDPVLGCNIRCRMCYFSDPEKRRQMHGVISGEQIDRMVAKLLPRALKLQIGCGAEPTLYRDLAGLIAKGKRAGVPFISITTNGQLIADGRINLDELVDAGLDEITLSVHGTGKAIYEELMEGAQYERFLELVRQLGRVKRSGRKLAVRVNFTVNSLNKEDLRENRFFQPWDDAGCVIDTVQIRPVQKIGESSWDDFDLSSIKNEYEATVGNVARRCRERGITCIVPTLEAIDHVDRTQEGASALIEDISYCYVSPDSFYKPDFDIEKDTFESWHRRHHTARRLLGGALFGVRSKRAKVSKKLNYRVK